MKSSIEIKQEPENTIEECLVEAIRLSKLLNVMVYFRYKDTRVRVEGNELLYAFNDDTLVSDERFYDAMKKITPRKRTTK